MLIIMTSMARKPVGMWFTTILSAIVFVSSIALAYGNEMTDFTKLRDISERIVRERAYDPQQLAALLSVAFEMVDDDLPNHFRYKASLENRQIFTGCDLRSPKTADAKTAILICDVATADIKADNIYQTYGESVKFEPAKPAAPPTAMHYLSVKFDNANLSFGVDQATDHIRSVVINFDL